MYANLQNLIRKIRLGEWGVQNWVEVPFFFSFSSYELRKRSERHNLSTELISSNNLRQNPTPVCFGL